MIAEKCHGRAFAGGMASLEFCFRTLGSRKKVGLKTGKMRGKEYVQRLWRNGASIRVRAEAVELGRTGPRAARLASFGN